jgi:hypothetical protein
MAVTCGGGVGGTLVVAAPCPLARMLHGLFNGWWFVERLSCLSRREARADRRRDRRPGDRNHVTGAAMDASATRNNVTRTVIDRPAPVDLITRFGGGTRR